MEIGVKRIMGYIIIEIVVIGGYFRILRVHLGASLVIPNIKTLRVIYTSSSLLEVSTKQC